MSGKFRYPVLKTGVGSGGAGRGRGANEAGERMKPEVVAVKCARDVSNGVCTHIG